MGFAPLLRHSLPHQEDSMRFQAGRLRMYVALIALSCGVMGVRGAEAAPNEQSASPAHRLAGSWIVTYDVPAFGAPFDLLLSMGDEGVVIETDAPGAFPLGPIS